MNNSNKLITIEQNDLSFLILCAGRYCEGRKSYAPGMLRSIVRKHWTDLSINQRDIFIKDLNRYLEDIKKWYPDIQNDYDYKEWIRFREEMTPICCTADEENYDDDSHGINIILSMLLRKDTIKPSQCEAAYKFIKEKLDYEGMWIGDDDHEAERFISFYKDELISSIPV